nr:MAG TPA: hypothetical protein [Bacteriophage sp.]
MWAVPYLPSDACDVGLWARVASSLVGKYSPVASICIPAVSLRVVCTEYIFFLCMRSCCGRLLVCFLYDAPRRNVL